MFCYDCLCDSEDGRYGVTGYLLLDDELRAEIKMFGKPKGSVRFHKRMVSLCLCVSD
ncbi:hypothetical protein HanPI659440_Chr16g0648271 [Helianthus annuus]|nr:hypothetical protein HanPI659440_Chr16g0648271 [Helianthus annuus]